MFYLQSGIKEQWEKDYFNRLPFAHSKLVDVIDMCKRKTRRNMSNQYFNMFHLFLPSFSLFRKTFVQIKTEKKKC